MRKLTFGSLFAGIGGFDLGLERAGMECKWQVEIDDFACRVLAKHWPGVHRERDVKKCGGHNLEQVDVICGGFPCQDISLAGKGAGLAGERSGLWHEFARIIGEIRPRYVIVENVSALLARGMDTVLGDLSEIGYDAEWHIVPASAVGAPHRRERVWIVAYANSVDDAVRGDGSALSPAVAGRRCNAGGSKCDSGAGCAEKPREGASDAGHADGSGKSHVAYANTSGYAAQRYGINQNRKALIKECEIKSLFESSGSGWWAAEPAVGRVAHGIPNRVDRLRGLGNAVVPQIVELIGRAIVEMNTRLA